MSRPTLILLSIFHLLLFSSSLPFDDSYDYSEVLKLSLLFYEAQRSGQLPKGSRISWRGDSALNDRGVNGEDLTGGYYDGQFEYALDAIKWASDYFIKCHVSPNEFYGQVGDFDLDHMFWGRPEDLNMSRPAYKIDINHPGSDLAGEAAAALAATSLVFREVDENYSDLTLKHAKELYNFAYNYRGLYNDPIPGAKKYYESTDYGDELTWAASWIAKATNDSKYILEAEQLHMNFRLKERPNEFFYNKKVAGVQVLLAELTKQPEYFDAVKFFCDFSVDHQKRTPKGLIYIDKFGTLSHAANVAFICLKAADLGISAEKYGNFAKQQINYILGDSGRSYIVGYGKNYPKQPYHAASSCPDRPAKCNWSFYTNPGPNPQILYGALVSGPDENDYYQDTREEYLYNEISLDYNAGFQSTIAGLIQRQIS